MDILLAMEKWCDLNPALGVTSANSNLLGSLRCAGHGVTEFYYDEYRALHGRPVDEEIVRHVESSRTDLMVVSHYPHPDERNISFQTMRRVASCGTPVVAVWFDFVHRHIRDLALRVADHATLSVVVDTYDRPDDRFLPMWVPQDESVFHRGGEKSVEVSFVGSTAGYQERVDALGFLGSHGVKLRVSGGQREHRLTIEQYAQKLRESYLTLNFPSKPDGSTQAKSRIYESMLCGALLLERENDAIKRWFEPMVHYVPFRSRDDLIRSIRTYLNDADLREGVVNNAHEKMTAEYNSKNWWSQVCGRARELT